MIFIFNFESLKSKAPMKKFFIDKVYNPDHSVTIKEFKELPKELFSKDIQITPDMGFCVILDTETTGLDFEKDQIIEIAIREWIYHKKDHYLIKPVEEYSQLNAPVNNEITPAITKIIGITKEDVEGKKIYWSIVSRLIGELYFILAHNAGLDRPMIESSSRNKKNLFIKDLGILICTSRLGKKRDFFLQSKKP